MKIPYYLQKTSLKKNTFTLILKNCILITRTYFFLYFFNVILIINDGELPWMMTLFLSLLDRKGGGSLLQYLIIECYSFFQSNNSVQSIIMKTITLKPIKTS